jgi:hypothetical protein
METKNKTQRNAPATKALIAERQDLYRQLGYAGNTRSDVAQIGAAIDAINAKLSGK